MLHYNNLSKDEQIESLKVQINSLRGSLKNSAQALTKAAQAMPRDHRFAKALSSALSNIEATEKQNLGLLYARVLRNDVLERYNNLVPESERPYESLVTFIKDQAVMYRNVGRAVEAGARIEGV